MWIPSSEKAAYKERISPGSYRPLKQSITKLMNKKQFISLFLNVGNVGRTKEINSIKYDGNVWKTFEYFLANPNSYLLSLNVDWFQPFKHITYSTGALYLTVQNLPRSERYKKENAILVGLMPGPNVTQYSLVSFSIGRRIKEFWKGVLIPVTCNGITECSPCNNLCKLRHTSKQESMWISGTLCQIGM